MITEETSFMYFLCHPRGDKTKITVIDLDWGMSYEREEWCNVNDLTFHTAEEAITYGRALAEKYNLEYILFDSRYDSTTSETHQGLYL